MSAFDPSAPGLPIVGGGGGLPAATGAGQIPVSDGAGTSYTATDASAVVIDALDGLYAELAEGDFLVGSGGSEVGVASDHAAAVRAAIGVQDGPRLIPLFAYATADNATPVVQALAGFTPSDYAISGRTTVLTLDAIGSVTSGSQTGTLEALNAAGTVVATLTWTETTPTRKTASITLPGGAEIYRARVSCAGVTDPLTDYALIGGAVLRVTWS